MTEFSSKECAALERLLTLEESACKKARLYSRTLTDIALAEETEKKADRYEARYRALLELL